MNIYNDQERALPHNMNHADPATNHIHMFYPPTANESISQDTQQSASGPRARRVEDLVRKRMMFNKDCNGTCGSAYLLYETHVILNHQVFDKSQRLALFAPKATNIPA